MSIVSSKRYAQAIFQIASEEKEFDQWSQDMESMAKIIGQPEFMAFLIAKRIPVSEKNKIINDALLEARCVVVVSEAMTNFLEPFGITGDPITGSPFLIDDPLILNPNYQEFPLNRCDDHQGADEEQ